MVTSQHSFGATGQRYDPGRSVISYIAEWAEAHPDAPALLLPDRAVSYGALLQQAEVVAHYLVGLGLGPGDFVGVWATRSAASIVGMLGALRAGAAFVALDPSYASETQLRASVDQVPFGAVVIEDGQAEAAEAVLPDTVPRRDLSAILAAPPEFMMADWPDACGEDPVTMVFTSGTTGTPKGVVLPNRGLSSLALDQPIFGVEPQDRVLHASSVACDGGLWELSLGLLNGAGIAVLEGGKPALDAMADVMVTHQVTVVFQYAGMLNMLIDHHAADFASVRMVMSGGDVISVEHMRKLREACPDIRLINGYGPSEASVCSLSQEVTDDLLTGAPVPIGRPGVHEWAFVVDEDLRLLPEGEWGQLVIGGPGVALGYFGLSERTAQSFVEDPREGHGGLVYLTGDMALRRPDGVFEFGGRADRQIKLDGRRIELDGVEHVLRGCSGVNTAVVEVIRAPQGDRRIGAALLAEGAMPQDPQQFRQQVLAEAGKALQPEMLPRHVLIMSDLPLTPQGKPDRRAVREDLEAELAAPQRSKTAEAGSVRAQIAEIWDEMLGCGPVPDSATFFDMGGSSLRLIEAHARIQKALDVQFDIMMMFETPQLGRLAAELTQLGARVAAPEGAVATTDNIGDGAIAVIGMAARVPGVDDLDAFWTRICDGDNLIQRFDPAELDGTAAAALRSEPGYVPARSILRDVDQFDAKFFGILPRDAEQMDPQARVFLELCVQALDDAGVDPARAPGAIGVYAGNSMSTYLLHNLLADRARVDAFTTGFQVADYGTSTGNITDALATRVAFKLNLKGPAITVHTACSTSMTAIAQAVTALRAGQCDAALAGGVSITFPQERGYVPQEGGLSSDDGLCRPFDAQASGTVFGHGAGVVVLKPLARALADGDRVEAVIRGVGLNNDGADKMAFTAPSVTGQAAAIRAAQADAGIAPETVSYVECHGTATPLGDPIEVRALRQAFGAEGRCALGSVKGNVGHLDAAAGVVSVIKTVRMLREAVIPPVAHFQSPNPRIDLSDGRFYVPQTALEWISDGPRRAGVSGFGVGGTNVHLLLEEAPVQEAEAAAREPVQVLPLSAKSPEALAQMAEDLQVALDSGPDLGDVAHTLQTGRSVHPYRLAIAAKDAAHAAAQLRLSPAIQRPAPDSPPPVVFLFPGQGGQYAGMGSELYADDPVYAGWLDAGLEVLQPLMRTDLRPLLTQPQAAEDALTPTDLAQPALFLTQLALAQSWMARGIMPAQLIGHSVGEFTAAALAGVLSFEEALRLVAARGRLMQAQPAGAMMSVRAARDVLEAYLRDSVDLAASNAPKLHVVAGPKADIAAMEAELTADSIAVRRLHTSHAFHSRMMAPAAEALRQEVAQVTLSAPRVPMLSTLTAQPLTASQATDPGYWADQARAPVRFAEALAQATTDHTPLLLEVGAGAALTTFAAQGLDRTRYAAALTSLPDHSRSQTDTQHVLHSLGQIWAAGGAVEWRQAVRAGQRKLRLPGTRFQRQRHWIDAPAPQTGEPAPSLPAISQPIETVSPMSSPSRPARLLTELIALFSDLSGEELTQQDAATPFLELGFDSLFMGQVAQAVTRDYGVPMTFRSLLNDHPSLQALAAHLDAVLPPDPVADVPQSPAVPAPAVASNPPAEGSVAAVIQAQMATMQAVFAEQLRALGAEPQTPVAPSVPAPAPVEPIAAAEPKAFTVGRAPSLAATELTDAQMQFVRMLAEAYSAKFPTSKAHTQTHRQAHADPRSAAGFRPEWKELTFPIVAETSKGAYIEDVDGNRLIDLVNGFGQTAFGHAPDFVSQAVQAQMARGFAIGPQADTAGPTAAKFARMVGHERVTFCNTGSEAVMAAMRLARAVTGREKIVVFSNDYHGQFDEVLVKGRSRGAPVALPLAPGIPRSSVANMIVLGYDDPASLEWISSNINEIAGVVVEPVQSRYPERRSQSFVKALRRITADGGAALVMDEVVTGFRVHARGMQGLWDIQPDMATYGKVVGGGLPVGLLAGSSRFMDALDGGVWDYGDDSAPQTAPTFFAGTFVRHPLVVAAVDAVLDHLETDGDRLWSDATALAASLSERLNASLAARGLPPLVTQFSSWFVLNVSQHDPRATLLYALMRLEGVHILDGFCGFLTTEHGEADCDRILTAFERSVDALQAVGILVGDGNTAQTAPAQAQVSGPQPLSEHQREIWMTHQLGPLAAASFNESVSFRISGSLHPDHLQEALNIVLARHDALRMVFARDGQTVDVRDGATLDMARVDLSTAPEADSALAGLLRGEAETPFDLASGLPIRAQLVQLGATEHVLILVAHHIVCDGWSFGVLANELGELVTALQDNRPPALEPAPSFAALPSPETRSETLAYWRGVYADIPELPDLPCDRPRPAHKSFAGATRTTELGRDLLQDLRKAGAPLGCTLFGTLFAGLQILLGRLSQAQDIVLAVPTAGQMSLPNPATVGHLVNFLPVRAPFDAAEPVSDHLRRVAQVVSDSFEHGDTTLGALVRDLEVPRSLARLPLTEVQFNLERAVDDQSWAGATVRTGANPKAAVNYDLFFNAVEHRDGLRLEVDYNTGLFDGETVDRWVGHLQTVLRALAARPETAICDLPLMSDAETLQLATTHNRTEAAVPQGAVMQDLIAAQVERTPDATALTDATGAHSYADIWARSGAVAALIQSRVPDRQGRIGVALPRDAGLVEGLLAVLRAGHTYVPLDPATPLARLRQVLDTAEVCGVLTTGELLSALRQDSDIPCIDPAEAQAGATPETREPDADAAAYVIFTSGSTGAPKGVAVPHRAVVNFLTSMARCPGLSASDRMLAVTTVSFDIAVLELFGPLTVGGQVEIATREQVIDGFQLVARLDRGDITVMQATPTLWAMLVEAGLSPADGLTLLAGGESLPQDLADRLMAKGAVLWNMYGPTETTIWSAVDRVEQGQPISIGAPIANTELHVLDARDHLCPPGVVGELNIGGAGLALGYHGRPDVTDAAFRQVTLAGQSRRLYRTGDLAVRQADGTLTLLGRRDTQVKLRGHRIELEEIETHLRAEDAVLAAAVALRPAASGADHLVAYVVTRPGDNLDAAALDSRLRAALPDYMVPAAWVPLSTLPQTANGKLDRGALPDPEAAPPVRLLRSAEPPATDTEARIAEVWAEVLGQKSVSVTDTLFALGLDSLAVFRIAARLLEQGMGVEAKHVLAHPTIRALAAYVDAAQTKPAAPARPSLRDFRRSGT